MASDVQAAVAAIETRFKDQWGAAHADVPVQWENVHFDVPNTAWVRFTVLLGDAFELTMGNTGAGQNEIAGVVMINLFDKPDIGAGPLKQLADDARDIFNRADVGSNVHFGAPSAPSRGSGRDGWEQFDVTCPFTVDETI
jgi:hypothetical protein